MKGVDGKGWIAARQSALKEGTNPVPSLMDPAPDAAAVQAVCIDW